MVALNLQNASIKLYLSTLYRNTLKYRKHSFHWKRVAPPINKQKPCLLWACKCIFTHTQQLHTLKAHFSIARCVQKWTGALNAYVTRMTNLIFRCMNKRAHVPFYSKSTFSSIKEDQTFEIHSNKRHGYWLYVQMYHILSKTQYLSPKFWGSK